jgi:hypothetical protein
MGYNIWESCVLFPGFSRSECASWVQAWGSIGAIVAATLLFWARGRRDKFIQDRAAAAEKVSQAKFALTVLHMALKTLNDFERFWKSASGQNWPTHMEELDDACDLLRDAALSPMFSEARAQLLTVRAGVLVMGQFSRRTVGHIAGGSRADLFLKIARGRIVEARAAIAAEAPGSDSGSVQFTPS